MPSLALAESVDIERTVLGARAAITAATSLPVAATSGAGIASGLAAAGGVVGAGMAAGTAVLAGGPACLAVGWLLVSPHRYSAGGMLVNARRLSD